MTDTQPADPRIQSLAFAEWVPAAELSRHVQRIRAEGFPDYEIHASDATHAAYAQA